MRPPPLSQRLVQAEEAAALGRGYIKQQHRLILAKEQRGADTTLSRALLATFSETQALHEADLDRLLAQANGPEPR